MTIDGRIIDEKVKYGIDRQKYVHYHQVTAIHMNT